MAKLDRTRASGETADPRTINMDDAEADSTGRSVFSDLLPHRTIHSVETGAPTA